MVPGLKKAMFPWRRQTVFTGCQEGHKRAMAEWRMFGGGLEGPSMVDSYLRREMLWGRGRG